MGSYRSTLASNADSAVVIAVDWNRQLFRGLTVCEEHLRRNNLFWFGENSCVSRESGQHEDRNKELFTQHCHSLAHNG